MEPKVSSGAAFPSTRNKLRGAPNRPIPPRSGHGGCGWRWGTGRSGAPGVDHEALLAKFISNGIVEPLLLSAREATSRLGARRPASGGSVVVESKDSTAFPSFF
jgi:hypothetical protein